jgi:hypothetical protein
LETGQDLFASEFEMARSDLELGYRLLEECIHGGRVSGRQLAQLMRGDPKFAEWLRARASARQAAPTLSQRLAATHPTQATPALPITENTSLMSLAAWLHRASKEAAAAANVVGSARLAQASAVVKEAADRERQAQSVPVLRPIAANQE